MKYKVKRRNNSTGEVREWDTKSEWDFDKHWGDSSELFWWTEGNFGRDCNRELVFYDWSEEADDRQCGETEYTVIHAELEDGTIIPIDDPGGNDGKDAT